MNAGKNLSCNIKLADRIVRMQFDDPDWKRVFMRFWKSYVVSGKATMILEITSDAKTLKTNIIRMTPDYLHISCHKDRLARYTFESLEYGIRKILGRWLFEKEIYLIHASGVKNKRGEALLFTGPHGFGKSTIVRLLPSCSPISDDSVFITSSSDGVYCYTTPFYERNHYQTQPAKLRVKAIFYLKKQIQPDIKKIPENHSLRKTIQLFFMLHRGDHQLFDRILFTANTLRKSIPWYNLSFPKNVSTEHFLHREGFV